MFPGSHPFLAFLCELEQNRHESKVAAASFAREPHKRAKRPRPLRVCQLSNHICGFHRITQSLSTTKLDGAPFDPTKITLPEE